MKGDAPIRIMETEAELRKVRTSGPDIEALTLVNGDFNGVTIDPGLSRLLDMVADPNPTNSTEG